MFCQMKEKKKRSSSTNVWQSATADDVCQLTGLCMVTFRWCYARSRSTRGIWLGDDRWKSRKDSLSKPLITKLFLTKKIIIKAPWPRIGLKSLETRRKLSPLWCTKLFTNLLTWIYIIICNSPRKHEHVTVMRINSRCPLSLRMPLNSPLSWGPLASGISSQQWSCCLHRWLCSRRKRFHFWTTIQTSLVNNMYFCLFILTDSVMPHRLYQLHRGKSKGKSTIFFYSSSSCQSCVSRDCVTVTGHVTFLTPKNITNSFVLLNSGSGNIF